MENYFASNLKYLRETRKISQQEIADKINVDRSTIGYWESGKADPTMLNVCKLADFFNIPITDLIRTNLKDEKELKNKEREEVELLKNILIRKGKLNVSDNLTAEEFDRLIDFAISNINIVNKK